MPTSIVQETVAVYAHAIDAIDLSKRATLRTVRSWSGIVESTVPGVWDGPWTLVTAGLDSAESFVTAQTKYAQSILDATATGLGIVPTNGAPSIAGRAHDETAVSRTSGTPKPAVKVEAADAAASARPAAKVQGATAPAPSRPKAPVGRVAPKPKALKASGDTKGK